MTHENSETALSRRTFLKGAGVAAGAAVVGTGATGSTAAHAGFHAEFANQRVRELRKVWDRGIRGHPERTLAITDTGIDARHPDLGPWNGITVVDGDEIDTDGDGSGITLTTPEALANRDTTEDEAFTADAGTVRFRTQVLAGAFVAEGRAAETVVGQFTVGGEGADGNTANAAPTPDADVLEAKLFWDGYNPTGDPTTANVNDLELRIDVQTADGGWRPVATAASADMPEVLEIEIQSGATYRYVAEKYTQFASQDVYVEETFRSRSSLTDTLGADADPFDGSKVVGWYDAGSRYGSFDVPRDTNGHGSHCSSIMAGSGRASAVDPDRLVEEEPNTVLTPGSFLEYEVDVPGGMGVFVSAIGDGIEVTIEGPDGRTLEDGVPNVGAGEAGLPSDLSLEDSAIAEVAVPPGEGGTYTCYVHPLGETSASAGRVEKVAAGAFRDPETAAVDGAGGDVSLHSGVAPNARLFGLQGLASPLPFLAESGQELTETFGIRSVNMSWGPGDPVTGLATPPFGAAGGTVSSRASVIKEIAANGILTCAAAGNSFTPGQSAVPALADEALAVAATGPLDGLTSYSSGGLAVVDEDEQRQYLKPDVSAPGGYLTDTVKAAKAKLGDYEDDDAFVQDYTGKAGTSMATPYTNGVVGLVAEAMEFDLPEHRGEDTRVRPAGVTLPEPGETGLDDVLRLKAIVCATATETAFTAAPYHRAHAPTYGHGEKDLYEGYGRVNPDAAVDAVTRELVDLDDIEPNERYTGSVSAPVGLNVPEDARAVAGFVDAPEGTIDASVAVSHLSGGNKGMAKGSPHVDLFVYDAENPGAGGEPTIAASAQGVQGSASASVDVGEPGTYLVVAKLVDVPGAVNGYDVQAHLDLDVTVTVAELPAFAVGGSRGDDGSAYTAGQSDQITVTVDSLDEGVDKVLVYDVIPESWTVQGGDGTVVGQRDGPVEAPEGAKLVELGEVSSYVNMDAFGPATFDYFVEAPDSTGQYTFGPARAALVAGDASQFSNEVATFGGTDDNVVVGVDQSDPTGSAPSGDDATGGTGTGGSGSTTTGDDGSVVDTVTDGL